MPRPSETTYSPFQKKYIDQTIGYDDVKTCIEQSIEGLSSFWKSIPIEKYDFAYAEGKWTLRQMLQHLIDTERILSFRALSVARGETQSLPGFEEDDYAKNSHAELRDWNNLIDELLLVRRASILLVQSFTDKDLARVGIANGNPTGANALAFIIVGHALHHQQIVKERYLVGH
jgi:hypothetical protein